MGCDIHPFIEYTRWDKYWSLSEKPLHLPREYPLWNFIAFGDGGVTDDLPYPPRGLPENLSEDARSYFFTPEEELRTSLLEDDPDYDFSPERWLKHTWPAAEKEYERNGLLPANETHTHSWLTLAELEQVLAWAKWPRERWSAPFRAVIAAMSALAEESGKDGVRLVFCFDG